MSSTPGRRDWWQAEDGKWYPPDRSPDGIRVHAPPRPSTDVPGGFPSGRGSLVRSGFFLGIGVALGFAVVAFLAWLLLGLILGASATTT